MQLNQNLLSENVCGILSDSTWSESRNQELSWRLKYKMKRRGYELHEKAVLLLNSFSRITLQKESKNHNSRHNYRAVMKFISDDYFPQHLWECTHTTKKADVIFLNDFEASSACLIACWNSGHEIDRPFDSTSYIDFYIYLMANGVFFVCDYNWIYMWRIESFEDILSRAFEGNRFLVDDAIILDSPEYRPKLDKLGLPRM